MADTKISVLTLKATPIAADVTNILDSAAGNADKKVTLGSLPISTATQTALNLKADQTSISNINNTSDANKPVSTAQQTALDLKVDKAYNYVQSLAANLTTTLNTLVDTGLSFPIGANEKWQFNFNMQNGCNNTGGLKYAVITPSGSDMRAKLTGTTAGNTSFTSNILTTNVETAVNLNTVNSQGAWADVVGVVANGATPGVVKIQVRSITAGQTSTVYKESHVKAVRIS